MVMYVFVCACVCARDHYNRRTSLRNATPTVSSLSSPSIFIMAIPTYRSCDLQLRAPDSGDIGQIPDWDQSTFIHPARGQELRSEEGTE